MGLHRVIIGDSRIMKEIENESVHLIITSPPYWQLKDYGPREQIGYNDSYEDYINNLNLVWKECHRVLHKGCRMCINIGDQFARSVYYGRYKIIPIRTEIIKFCETVGFDYMGAIIWQKVTTCNTTGGATIMGSFPYPRNGIVKLDYEFILIFKKLGKSPIVQKKLKEKSVLTKKEWNQYFYGHWNFSGEKQAKHIAPFPEELPKRLIKMFSFVGDTVLDPFLGSGTTSLVAMKKSRNSIGYEINSEFLSTIEDRLTRGTNLFQQQEKIEAVKQDKRLFDIKKKINELPYIFKDPITISRKIDPKTLRFGSRIDGEEKNVRSFYTVKKILSPSKLMLDSGAIIRLIGIIEDKNNNAKAIEFIRKMTRGKKVLLKFDNIKYDKNNDLLCYLYLKNKTFLNSHLIKTGFVKVDTVSSYKLKHKFAGLTPTKRGKDESKNK